MHTKRKIKYPWKWMIGCVLILLLIAASPVFAEGEAAEEPGETTPVETVAESLPEEGTETPPEEELPLPEEAAESLPEAVVPEAVEPKSKPKSTCSDPLEDDPWYAIGTLTYRFFEGVDACDAFPGEEAAGRCFDELANPIQYAVDYIPTTGLPTDRTLHIEAGDYNGDVTIQGMGSILAQMQKVEGAGLGVSNIYGQFEVKNNLGGFELKGVAVFGGGTIFGGNSGTLKLTDMGSFGADKSGIDIHEHLGSVEITDSRAGGNYGSGVLIDNALSTGSVTVLNSVFNGNGHGNDEYLTYGLNIVTSRIITIEGVTANGNSGNGIDLRGFSKLGMKYVIANDNEEAYTTENWCNKGIVAWTEKNAPVILEHIQTNSNGGYGFILGTLGSVKAKYIEAYNNSIRNGAIYVERDLGGPVLISDIIEFLSRDVEYDEWRFELSATTYLEFTLESDKWEHGFDPVFEVYEEGNPTPVLTDDNSLDGWNAFNTATLGPGVYYVQVKKAGDQDTYGEYRLFVDDLTPGLDNWRMSDGGFVYLNWGGSGTFKLENGSFGQNAFDGLHIENRNTVILSTVQAHQNGQNGVYIDKTGETGGIYTGIGSVTVTSPKATAGSTANGFSQNGGAGILIASRGNVTVSNFDAYENYYSGVEIDNCLYDEGAGTCMGTGNVTVNVSIPNWGNGAWNNGDYGYRIDTKGNATIDNCGADSNPRGGFDVYAMGTIKMNNVNSTNNGDYGAKLVNAHNPLPKTVTVIDSWFDNNNNTGLYIDTNGAIILKGVNSVQNHSPGGGWVDWMPVTYFDQMDGDPENYNFYLDGSQSMQFILRSYDFDAYLRLYDETWTLIFQDDDSYGGYNGFDAVINETLPAGWYTLQVDTAGGGGFGHYELSINDEGQEHNRFPGSGAELFNSVKPITFSPTKQNTYMRFNDNSNMGIYLKSLGVIKLTNTEASGNGRTGLSAANPDSTKPLTVQDTTKYPETGFSDNGWTGIYARTGGTIKLKNIRAERNGDSGVDLDNCLWDDGLGMCMGSGSISIEYKKNMEGSFSNNGNMGIEAHSKGSIKLININASENGRLGAKLKNRYDGSSGTVTITTSGDMWNWFDRNGWRGENSEFEGGLMIGSHGNITIKNTSASENTGGLSGLSIYSSSAPVPRNVSITNGQFNNNESSGMGIGCKGNITVKDIQANWNNGNGALLGNTEGSGNVYVKASKNGENQFNGNNDTGLVIQTNGKVTLSNVCAEDNFKMHGGWGDLGPTDTAAVHDFLNWDVGPDHWWFYAYPGTYDFYMQPSYRVDLDPYGFDPWIGLYDDGDTQLALDDDGGGYPNAHLQYTITTEGWYYLLANSAVAEESGFYQLSINDPSFSDMQHFWVSGASVNAGGSVTVSGSQYSEFHHNSLVGLGIQTPGTILLKGVGADNNGTEGFWIGNQFGTGNLTILGKSATNKSYARGNGWQGFSLYTNGNTTLKNIWAGGNRQEGVRLGTGDEPTGGNVVLNDLALNWNGSTGLSVDTFGKISASKIAANGNGDNGATFNNTYGGLPQTIIFSGDSFLRDNQNDGLIILSNGNVTVSKVTAEGNQNDNIRVMTEGNINVNNVISRYAFDDGLNLVSIFNNVLLYNIVSMFNGNDVTDGDGVYIEVGSATSVVTIKTSAFMSNAGNGIEVVGVTPTLFNLIKTYYFGNDVDGDWTPDQADLYVY